MNEAAPLPPQKSRRLLNAGGCLLVLVLTLAAAFWAYRFVMDSTSCGHGQDGMMCHDVATAVEQFAIEYQQLPLATVTTGVDVDTDTSLTSGLLPILKGTDVEHHSRRQDFLGDLKEAHFANGAPRGGLYHDGRQVALYDVRGQPFRVRLDSNGDETVADPDPEHAGRLLRRVVLVWGAGKDGDFATWEDNPQSWAAD